MLPFGTPLIRALRKECGGPCTGEARSGTPLLKTHKKCNFGTFRENSQKVTLSAPFLKTPQSILSAPFLKNLKGSWYGLVGLGEAWEMSQERPGEAWDGKG